MIDANHLIKKENEETIADALPNSGLSLKLIKNKDALNLSFLSLFVFSEGGYDVISAIWLLRSLLQSKKIETAKLKQI